MFKQYYHCLFKHIQRKIITKNFLKNNKHFTVLEQSVRFSIEQLLHWSLEAYFLRPRVKYILVYERKNNLLIKITNFNNRD